MAGQHASVDAYIAGFPPDVQERLQALRATIRAAAPGATESISYGIPTFRQGKAVVMHMAGWKHHLAVYPALSGDEALQRELAPYRQSKGSLHFPHDQPLPLDLIQRAVRARLAEIAGRSTRPG
jgi:uncharacterized protein YdhG (YjbR/CyaY superfamily)